MGVTIIFKKSLANMMLSGKRGYVILAFAYMVLVYAVCKIIERRKFGYSLVAIRGTKMLLKLAACPPPT